MMKTWAIVAVALGVLLGMNGTGQASSVLTLPDGTVTASTGAGPGSWWGESVTTLRINAQGSLPVLVTGEITGISATATSWVEIGLIPKATWDSWHGSSWPYAVFDKGIYVVDWLSNGLGLSLDENKQFGGQLSPFAWPLAAPSTGNPWDFSITMYPSGSSGGNASLSVAGAAMYGASPLAYTGNYSDSYLIAQIWSNTQNATFSFQDVTAEAIPEPLSMGLVFAAISGLGMYYRSRRKMTAVAAA